MSVENKLHLLWFSMASLCNWLAKLAPHFQPVKSKTKPRTLSFSRTLGLLHVIASNSDWFVALVRAVVIG